MFGGLILVLSLGILGLAILAVVVLPKDAQVGVHVGTKGFDGLETRNVAVGVFLGLAAFAVALALLTDAHGMAALILGVTFLVDLVAVIRAMADDVG